jgi:hypothetical protein
LVQAAKRCVLPKHIERKSIMSNKLFALATAALIGTSSVAAANIDYFSLNPTASAGSSIDMGVVRASGDGVVEVYELRGGELGALLGSQPVTAGANSNVSVSVGIPPRSDVMAVLRVNGEIVATNQIRITR